MSKQSKVPKALAGSLAALVMLAAGVSIQNAEPTPEALRNEYIQAVAADQTTSMAVKIAMVMGSQYESSGKHIGKPYVDKLGRGQPLTESLTLLSTSEGLTPGPSRSKALLTGPTGQQSPSACLTRVV